MLRNSPGPPPLRPDVFRCFPAGEKYRSSRLFPSATTTTPELSRTAPSTEPNSSGPSASLEPIERMGRSDTRQVFGGDRKSTRMNSSDSQISYAVFCLKKKKEKLRIQTQPTST